MNTLRTPLVMALRLFALTEIVLGLLFWTGHAFNLVPLHMAVGILFTLAYLGVTGLAASRGLPVLPAILAGLWAVVIPTFGMAQTRLLVGPYHWIIRVAHLLVAVVAMQIAERVLKATDGKETPTASAGVSSPKTA